MSTDRAGEVALCMLAAVVFVALVVGLAGGWRWVGRLFLFGLVAAAVQLALIALVFPHVATWLIGVTR